MDCRPGTPDAGQAETKDQEEDALYGPDKRGDELPSDLQQRSSRLARLRQCKEQLEEEAARQDTQANPTDPDSRLLKIRLGYLQGYNAQLLVNQGQVILAAHLAQERNDWHQLPVMVRQAEKNLIAAGITRPIGTLLADAGYLIPEPTIEISRMFAISSPFAFR